MAGEMSGASPFLWIDRQADKRRALIGKLQLGEVVSARLQTRDGQAEIDVPDGLIHHWVGTVLLPGATIDRVMAFVKDYQQYPARFAPMIQRAQVLKQSPDRFDVTMRKWRIPVGRASSGRRPIAAGASSGASTPTAGSTSGPKGSTSSASPSRSRATCRSALAG
jgi:hypothetical protein